MINHIIDDIAVIIVLKIDRIATSSLNIVITQCFKILSWNAKIKKKDMLLNFYFNLVEEDFYGSTYKFFYYN